MQGSRVLEVTRKTKFRPHAHGEEGLTKKSKDKKIKRSNQNQFHKGFDMWEDHPDDGC